MLSRTIYQLTTTLDQERQEGAEITPRLQATLIDVMFEWHKLAVSLEQRVEELEVQNNDMANHCIRTMAAQGGGRATVAVKAGDPNWVPMIVGGVDMNGGGDV